MSVSVGVLAASGPTGREVCRLLLAHPAVGNIRPSSRRSEAFDDVHPNLRGCGLAFESDDQLVRSPPEVMFLCAPTGTAMGLAPGLLSAGSTVIDLSADFRFADPASFTRAHDMPHTAPSLLPAAYGLPELDRESLRHARCIANPGCFATAILLALAAVVEAPEINLTAGIVVHALNGTTGADLASPQIAHPHAANNVLPYGLAGHRHVPEIEERLRLGFGVRCGVDMSTAHGSFARGICAQLSLKAASATEGLRGRILERFVERYGAGRDKEPFVRVVDRAPCGPRNKKDYGRYPQPAHVLGSNLCHLGADVDAYSGSVKLVSVVDNLGKGAAGNAVQVMNLVLGLPETTGLGHHGL